MERSYTPGVCNLSDAEAWRRNTAGWIGLAISIALEVYFVSAELSPTIRLVIFFPATFGAMGFLQGVMHFSARFGMRGVFNVRNEIGRTETVAEAEYRALDCRKAQRIILYSAGIGAAFALVAYFL